MGDLGLSVEFVTTLLKSSLSDANYHGLVIPRVNRTVLACSLGQQVNLSLMHLTTPNENVSIANLNS